MEANVPTQVETNWDLIPSDPDIFNDMLREYGVNQMEIKEAYDISFDEFIEKDSPVYGIIFASRYEEEELPEDIEEEDPDAENIVFTSQIITNVCATLALLGIVLNADIEKGEIIDNFNNFTEDFTAVNRGIALGNSPEIRKIHNAYGVAEKKANEAMQNYALQSTDDEDVESLVEDDNFHFISYIAKNGFIWQLDGMMSRPLKLAAVAEDQHWLQTLSPFLQQKMNDEMQFSILVATSNELTNMKKSLQGYIAELEDVEEEIKEEEEEEEKEEQQEEDMVVDKESRKRKSCREDDEEEDEMKKENVKKQKIKQEEEEVVESTATTSSSSTSSPSAPTTVATSLQSKKENVIASIDALQEEIEKKEEQQSNDVSEMARQKFDYFPFIAALVNAMKGRYAAPSS